MDELEPVAVGDIKFWDVWGWDEAPVLPYDGGPGYQPYSSFPPPGGVRVQAFQFPPRYPGQAEAAAEVDYSAISRLRRAFTDAVPRGRAYGAGRACTAPTASTSRSSCPAS